MKRLLLIVGNWFMRIIESNCIVNSGRDDKYISNSRRSRPSNTHEVMNVYLSKVHDKLTLLLGSSCNII